MRTFSPSTELIENNVVHMDINEATFVPPEIVLCIVNYQPEVLIIVV